MESETLLEQYKRCTKINQDQLKAAKNIEDLVNIKIQAIDKALLVNKDNTYNFHYDPVFFRQQVPLMADREFLINQALLLKSSQRAAKPQASFNVHQELFHEADLFNIKQDIHRNIAHGGLDIIRSRDPLYKQEMKKIDFDELRNKNNGSQSVTPGETPALINDPIVVLKKLFKPKEFGNRILDKNLIVNKYKQKHLEDLKKQQRKQQIKLQKQFAEDQVEQPTQFDVISSNMASERQDEVPALPALSYRRSGDDYKSLQQEVTYVDALHKNEPHKDTMIGSAGTTQHLRNKLESLRKMFDEDDTVHLRMQQGYFQNVPALAAMPDYEFDSKLPKHVFDNTHTRLKKDIQSQETSAYPSDRELGEQEQDLRVFLTHKIQDIKNKMTANEKAIDLSDFSKPVQSKFKVSKLNDIQSIRASGTSQKLEDDFKSRVNKVAVDNQFKNALLSQDRKFNKQLAQTVNKFNEVHLLHLSNKQQIQTPKDQNLSDQTPNYQQQAEDYFLQNQGLYLQNHILTPVSNNQLEQQLLYDYHQQYQQQLYAQIPSNVQNQQPGAPLRNSSAPQQPSKLLRRTFGPQSNASKKTSGAIPVENKTGDAGFKSAKHRNFVFQQMMKIEKIDRDMEKRNKERQMEIKNKDIEVIIQRTKQEIKNEEQIQSQAAVSSQYNNQEGAPPVVYNEATEESMHQEVAHGSINQEINNENAQYDQTYDYGKIEINQEDLDNGIENNTVQEKIVSQLNSEMENSVQQFNAGMNQSQKDQGKLKVQSKPMGVNQHSNNSASQESKFSVPSKLNLQPFSDNRASQVISNNQSSFDPFSNQYKTDVMGQTSHRTQYPDLHYSKNNLRQSQDQTTDNTESFTDTEDYLQRKTSNFIKKASKVKMLKTSLYEIREEGYHSNTSSPNHHMDQFRMTFSSKRFNRYPRFTIFLKKNGDGMGANKYAIENTISLNPQFLSYLQESNLGNGIDQSENQNFLEEQQKEQGIIIINEKTRQQIKIDPFEKVILVKGIDNSILTSFRTLRKQNNLVSDTLKVIHNKFQPFNNKHSSFMVLSKNQATKLPYPMTDDEDSLQFAATKLYLQKEEVGTRTNSPQAERLNSDNNLMKNNTASFGGLLNQNQIQNLGYSLIIGDTQINLDQIGETERKMLEKQKNLHDSIGDSKSPQADKNARKKTTSSTILNAGGAGGGIRQNAKVIKSKNAFLVGTGPWNTQAAPKMLGNEVSSELGNLIHENMLSNHIDIKDSSFAKQRMTDHIDQSHIDSIEENTSLVIDQSHIQTYHPNTSTFNNGQQNILVSHEHDIDNNARNASQAAQPHALGLMGHTLTGDSLEAKDKHRLKGQGTTNQIILSQRPQGIKVETSYKPRPQNNNDLGKASDQESSLQRNKSIKPVYRMTRYDPMLNAFPDSINSTVLTGSIINTSMLPGVMTATVKSNIKNQATSSNAVDILPGSKEAGLGSPEIANEGGLKGKKIGMAATARNNNLRASHAGGFVFEPNSAKNTYTSNGVWPKNLGQPQMEVQKSQLMPQTMRGGDQMTISLPPLLANNSLHNQYREVINRQYQERSPQSRQQQKRLPNNNQSKIKQVIDELYQKEKRYVKQYIREDLIHPHNTIFNLERCYNLQTATGVEKNMDSKLKKQSYKDKAIVGEYKNGQIQFREEQPTDRNASRFYGSFQRKRSGSPNSPPRID